MIKKITATDEQVAKASALIAAVGTEAMRYWILRTAFTKVAGRAPTWHEIILLIGVLETIGVHLERGRRQMERVREELGIV